MNKRFTGFFALFLLFTAGCSKAPSVEGHVVVWRGMTDLNSIAFTIDGKKVGTGETGLKNVLSFLDSCEPKSVIHIQATIADWKEQSVRYHVDHPLPYEAFRVQQLGDFSEEFSRIVGRLDLQIKQEIAPAD